VCTVLLLLPVPWLLYSLFFGVVGALVYVFVLCPWALRDLWRHPR